MYPLCFLNDRNLTGEPNIVHSAGAEDLLSSDLDARSALMAALRPVGTSPTAVERHVTSVATTGSRPSARKAASKTARTFVVGCTRVSGLRALLPRWSTQRRRGSRRQTSPAQYPASDGCAAPRPATCPTRQVVECQGLLNFTCAFQAIPSATSEAHAKKVAAVDNSYP
jgi:hypothetical protein